MSDAKVLAVAAGVYFSLFVLLTIAVMVPKDDPAKACEERIFTALMQARPEQRLDTAHLDALITDAIVRYDPPRYSRKTGRVTVGGDFRGIRWRLDVAPVERLEELVQSEFALVIELGARTG